MKSIDQARLIVSGAASGSAPLRTRRFFGLIRRFNSSSPADPVHPPVVPAEALRVAQTRTEPLIAIRRGPPHQPVGDPGILLAGLRLVSIARLAGLESLTGVPDAGASAFDRCLGHLSALAGDVGNNPQGMEIGIVAIEPPGCRAERPLFSALSPQFRAQVAHEQSVLRLTPGATVPAGTAHEPQQAFRVGRSAYGACSSTRSSDAQ